MRPNPNPNQPELEMIFARYAGERSELIPILQDTQRYFGYLPDDAMQAIADFLSMPESQVYGVATFYEQFYFTRRGKNKIVVCYGTACHVKGATRLIESFERQLGIACGSTTEDYEYSLERVACVGCCSLAPVVLSNEEIYAHVTPDKVAEILGDRRDRRKGTGEVNQVEAGRGVEEEGSNDA